MKLFLSSLGVLGVLGESTCRLGALRRWQSGEPEGRLDKKLRSQLTRIQIK